MNFRMVNRFSPSDGDLKTVDTQSTEFESGDGLEMQYEEKEFVDESFRRRPDQGLAHGPGCRSHGRDKGR